jgi:RNA:NAD 2'-phosphotransferase (TPT1/KptA family)
MTEKETIRTSKFFSLILWCEPERLWLTLGEAGWSRSRAKHGAISRK